MTEKKPLSEILKEISPNAENLADAVKRKILRTRIEREEELDKTDKGVSINRDKFK